MGRLRNGHLLPSERKTHNALRSRQTQTDDGLKRVRKMERFNRDHRGQSGLFDAVLFFLVLFTALSTLQFASQANVQDVVDRQYLSQFTVDTRATLLSCTINSSWYRMNGALIVLEDKTVEELLVEDLWLRSNSQVDDQSLEKGIEQQIHAILVNLTGPEYHFRLLATFPAPGTQSSSTASTEIVISDGYTVPNERWAATGTVMMPHRDGRAEIALMLWQ